MHAHLADLLGTFVPRVEQVTERIYVAIGFGLANTIVIVGDDGIVVVDVGESMEAAGAARDALRAEIPDLPVRAVVYTHGHADHVWGARAWVAPGDEAGVEIVAHESLPRYVHEFTNVLAPRYTLGAMKMFGSLLTDGPEGFVVNGIGPRLRAGQGVGYLAPTRTFAQRDALTVAGIRLELGFAPGESPDQIHVWLPDDDALLSGDNVYRSFPNIYTIRGARFRDPRDWYGSVDALRAYGAAHLVPSHGGPVSGRDDVDALLTAYRDGIQFVFDQTVRAMNAGADPRDLAAHVVLPPHLAEHPYLREVYGRIDLCARQIHAGLYGWFGGDAVDLIPTTPAAEAAEIVELAGGVEKAVAAAQWALDDDHHAWAARLAGHVLVVEPGHPGAIAVQAAAFRHEALATGNANVRNWLLTEAAILEGLGATPELATRVARAQGGGVVERVPVRELIAAWPVRLDPVAAAAVTDRVRLVVPDADTEVVLAFRRGVCAVEPVRDGDGSIDLVVTVARPPLVSILQERSTWTEAVADGGVTVAGRTVAAPEPTARPEQRWLALTRLFDDW